MQKGLLIDLNECEVLSIVYDIVMWANLIGWGLTFICSTLIFIGLAIWFRFNLIAELMKKRRYSFLLGGLWFAASCSFSCMILDRQGRFASHDRLATVLYTLALHAAILVCYINGRNTRDTAAAMNDSMKAKMKNVGRVFNVVFMLETVAIIIAIILDDCMISLITMLMHYGIVEPIHVVVCGRMKLAVFEFLEGVNNPAKKKEFGMRKRRFQFIQIFVLVLAVIINVAIVMAATKYIPAFYVGIPVFVLSFMALFMCPILARRLFKIDAKVAPKKALVQMIVVQSGDRQRCGSSLSSEEKSNEVGENNEEKKIDYHQPPTGGSVEPQTFEQESKTKAAEEERK